MKAARNMGADVVNVGSNDLREAVRYFSNGEGVDIALECAGHPESVRACLESLRPMGRYTQVAICGREITFPIDQVFYKQLTVRGSITYPCVDAVTSCQRPVSPGSVDGGTRAGSSSGRVRATDVL